MREKSLTVPDIGFIAVTRVALGVGIGLLVSCGLNSEQRRILGSALIGAGIVTTIPILLRVFGKEAEERRPVVLVA